MQLKKLKMLVFGLLSGLLSTTSAAYAQNWEAIDSKDAITDEVARKACSTNSEYRLCFSFKDDGVWATVESLGPGIFDTELFPALRIDKNEAVTSVDPGVLNLEQTLGSRMLPRSWQPHHETWRAQVPSPSGKWTATPPILISQLISGKSLLVRVYLSGGYQKDLNFDLAGFCSSVAKVYAQSAPPLTCP